MGGLWPNLDLEVFGATAAERTNFAREYKDCLSWGLTWAADMLPVLYQYFSWLI